jgi:hypothetical protein
MLSFFEAAVVVYFNKKMAEDLGFEDLYDLVRAGEWTYDKLYEFMRLAIRDNSGAGAMGAEDNWGMTSETDYLFPCFWISAGINLVEKDEDDIPYFAIPGNQKFFNIAERVIMEFQTDGMLLNTQQNLSAISGVYGNNNVDARVAFFRNGRSFFNVSRLSDMIWFRDMPDDFGIIPFPKYDTAQQQYYTRVCVGFPFIVPATIQNPEISGAVMEAMACEARNTIIPAYYESSLQLKFARDADTAEMLDLIFDTRVYDLGDTIWCMPIRQDYGFIFARGENTFASHTDAREERYRDLIQKSVDAILDNN